MRKSLPESRGGPERAKDREGYDKKGAAKELTLTPRTGPPQRARVRTPPSPGLCAVCLPLLPFQMGMCVTLSSCLQDQLLRPNLPSSPLESVGSRYTPYGALELLHKCLGEFDLTESHPEKLTWNQDRFMFSLGLQIPLVTRYHRVPHRDRTT